MWNCQLTYVIEEHQGNMCNIRLAVYHGMQLVGCVTHGLLLDIKFWGTPGRLELQVRDAANKVVGVLVLMVGLSQVLTGKPPESPCSAVPRSPRSAVPAGPEVFHLSRAAQIEETFRSTSVAPIPLQKLLKEPDCLRGRDPRTTLHYLKVSGVNSSVQGLSLFNHLACPNCVPGSV